MNQIENKTIEAMAKAHCDFFGGDGWWDAGLLADTKPKALDAMRAAIAAMPVQAEPVAWHSPLGGLIEARQIAQQAYKDIEREKSINGHIAGNPYDVALSALNSVLGCLAVLVDPPRPQEPSHDQQ